MLIKSTSRHGVHVPFVYNLVTKCFYEKTFYNDYNKWKDYKTKLLKNNTTLKITDLGLGSRVTKSDTRQITEITKNAGSTKKRAQLLYRLNRYFKSKTILELGTSLGIAKHALHLGHKNIL